MSDTLEQFSVLLSSQKPANYLSESTLLSFALHSASIHLPDADNFTQFQAVQRAARKISSMNIKCLKLDGEGWSTDFLWAFHQGFYSPKQTAQPSFPQLTIAEQEQLNAKQITCDWVRSTINQSAAELSPVKLCESALVLLQQQLASQKMSDEVLTSTLIVGEELEQAGWHGIYQVGKGSTVPPAMMIIDYNPSQDPESVVDVALVGKGITFDSGGYSLKPSDGMSIMKSDMGGAATLTGALALAISRGLQKRVVLILCCAENMVSGNALKLGDIITYKNGLSVEILNSDAEGRLVLADGLLAANEYSPLCILDAATLTGSAKMALGRDYHAVLAYNQQLVQKMLSCASQENELAWQLPLAAWHGQCLHSSFADIANIHVGEGLPGASTAAAFLARFVEGDKTNWLHMDLSGSYQKNANDLWSAGGKGHGVATIAAFIENNNKV